MTLSEMVTIPLQGAYLCADMDCKTVSNNAHECPLCHSDVLNLSSILNRPQADAFAGVVVHWRKGWELK
jgi:hypothetical protein